jgi:preprotein translocase subunit SecD
MDMQRLRLRGGSPLLALVLAGSVLSSAGSSRAQPRAAPARGSCLAFHQVHPQVHAPAALQTRVPEGFRIYLVAYSERLEEGLVLRETPFVDGGDLAEAKASFDSATGQPVVILRFNDVGRAKLADFTQAHVGRAIAIVVGGRVISAPLVREPIQDGISQIGGSLTVKGADGLVAKLRSGTCAPAR